MHRGITVTWDERQQAPKRWLSLFEEQYFGRPDTHGRILPGSILPARIWPSAAPKGMETKIGAYTTNLLVSKRDELIGEFVSAHAKFVAQCSTTNSHRCTLNTRDVSLLRTAVWFQGLPRLV